MQHEYECFFFVADWQALSTDYEEASQIGGNVWEMVVDWLSVGVNPGEATLFIQSRIPEHAELYLLLSMITPLAWLERIPSYKDQHEQLKERDLATHGFLGSPLLQAADVLIYKAGGVPVGNDDVATIEMAREVARRFNFLYGREPGFEEKALNAASKLGKKNGKLYFKLRDRFQEEGDEEALQTDRALLDAQQNITIGDRERLSGYLEGGGKTILPEPVAMPIPDPALVGLDGAVMSGESGNQIGLREIPESVEQKLRTMPTDPARVRRKDPGDPEKCPVWRLHEVYSDQETRTWVQGGCKTAEIGCLDCKQPLIEAVLAEQRPIRGRSEEYIADPDTVRGIINEGCEAARETARETLEDVREAMGLIYRN